MGDGVVVAVDVVVVDFVDKLRFQNRQHKDQN